MKSKRDYIYDQLSEIGRVQNCLDVSDNESEISKASAKLRAQLNAFLSAHAHELMREPGRAPPETSIRSLYWRQEIDAIRDDFYSLLRTHPPKGNLSADEGREKLSASLKPISEQLPFSMKEISQWHWHLFGSSLRNAEMEMAVNCLLDIWKHAGILGGIPYSIIVAWVKEKKLQSDAETALVRAHNLKVRASQDEHYEYRQAMNINKTLNKWTLGVYGKLVSPPQTPIESMRTDFIRVKMDFYDAPGYISHGIQDLVNRGLLILHEDDQTLFPTAKLLTLMHDDIQKHLRRRGPAKMQES